MDRLKLRIRNITFIVLGGLTFQFGHFKYMLGMTLFGIMLILKGIWDDL